MENKTIIMNDSINKQINLVGLLGHPLKHTFSPFIHNKANELLDLNYFYLPFDVANSNLKNALKGMAALNIKGFNVTIPHKGTIVQYLDNLSEEVSIIGAANTIVNDQGKLMGYNTDINGITETLLPFKDELNGSTVTIAGAGGGARAAIFSLLRNFKIGKINIVNRTKERAENLKEYFTDKMKFDCFEAMELIPPDLVNVFQESKLIINATSVGMFPDVDDSIIILEESFQKGQIVFDFVYNPMETKLLKIAKKSGAITLNGLKMLVLQAAKSFELWTGEEMPVDKIYTILKKEIKS